MSAFDDPSLNGYEVLELELKAAQKRIAELDRKIQIGETWLLHTKKKHNVLQNRFNGLGRDYEKLYRDYTHFINRCSCKADNK